MMVSRFCHVAGHTGLLCVVITAFVTRAAVGQGCVVNDIVTQPNFELDKYIGKWYELDWIPPYFDSPDDYWIDYSENYTQGPGNTITATGVGRYPTDTTCGTFTKVYDVTNDDTKWTYNSKADGQGDTD